MDIDTALLRQTALFQGMEDGEIRQLLACLHCPVRRYGRGEFLWHAGDAVPMAGIVLAGCVDAVQYGEDGSVERIDTVVVSTQHAPEISHEALSAAIIDKVICKSIPAELMDENTRFLINPTGRFTIGGPMGDSGLTGRKIIVDTYGGYARHGGGAFSGKDPTKVDRSAAYAARYIAKNIVAAGLAKRCEIELAYAIGVANPVSLLVDTQGTGVISDDALAKIVREQFDLRPAGIIDMLNLRRPIYRQTAAFGHFGRTDVDLPWERVDRAEALRAAAGI